MSSDFPAAAFQDVVQLVTPKDVGNLHLVSSHFSQLAMKHAPYACLRLSSSSSLEYPQLWCQATKRLHVGCIHIHMTGRIAADVFEATMRLLAQTWQITELHLLGGKAATSPACLVSLQPIHYLKATLKTLITEDVRVLGSTADIRQLAQLPANQWQLQQLKLQAAWYEVNRANFTGGFSSIVLLLADVFPQLQHLEIHMPPVDLKEEVRMYELTPAKAASEAKAHMVPVVVAAAAVAQAIARLPRLESLAVYGLPDLWAVPTATSAAEMRRKAPWLFVVPPLARTTEAFAMPGLDVSHCLPLASAAAAMRTMDNLGSWLLQQQSQLMHVCLSCGSMDFSFQRKQQYEGDEDEADRLLLDSSSEVHSTTTDITAAGPLEEPVHVPMSDVRVEFSIGVGSSMPALSLKYFKHQLSKYSLRAASSLLCMISSCQLTIDGKELSSWMLGSLLNHLTSLKELKIYVERTASHAGKLFTSTASALLQVSARPGLKSLHLQTGFGTVKVKPDLLLPLTAAAGGPGNSLEELHLTGHFAAPVDAISGWYVLRQLSRLRALSIHHYGEETEFPVHSLPCTLEIFKGAGLDLQPGSLPDRTDAIQTACGTSSLQTVTVPELDGQHAEQAAEETADVEVADSLCSLAIEPAGPCPKLRVLHLSGCQLCDPSLLASKHLEELDTQSSKWPGGWVAVAVAWPAVRKMRLWLEDDSTDQAAGNPATVSHSMVAFKRLPFPQRPPEVPAGCMKTLQYIVTNLQALRHVVLVVCTAKSGLPDSRARRISGRGVSRMYEWLQQQLPWATVDLVDLS